MLALSVDEQDRMAIELGKVETNAKDATEAHKLSFPAAGKVVFTIQKRLELLKSSVDEKGQPKKPQISLATSLATYWESITKANGKSSVKLNNHWLSCAQGCIKLGSANAARGRVWFSGSFFKLDLDA